MDRSDYLAIINDSAAALRSAARHDLEAPVPSCPGWVVADIVRHVAGVHGWAAAIVTSGARAEFPALPDSLGGTDLIVASEQRTSALVGTLAGADLDRDVWTFGMPRTARFWLRRQANETLLHAWDARGAVGAPVPMPGDAAADGLDEFLHLIVPRAIKAKPAAWTGQTVHLHREDGPGEWLVTLGPDGLATIESEHAKGDAAVRATAADLFLWATGREPDGALHTFGDAALLERWRAEVTF